MLLECSFITDAVQQAFLLIVVHSTDCVMDCSGPMHWADITWTLRINDEYKIVAAPLNYDTPSVVYVVSEADKAGTLNASMAAELGVEKQRDFGRLKSGNTRQSVICRL